MSCLSTPAEESQRPSGNRDREARVLVVAERRAPEALDRGLGVAHEEDVHELTEQHLADGHGIVVEGELLREHEGLGRRKERLQHRGHGRHGVCLLLQRVAAAAERRGLRASCVMGDVSVSVALDAR